MQWLLLIGAAMVLAVGTWAKIERDSAAQWEAKAKHEAVEREKLRSAYAAQEQRIAELNRQVARQRRQLREALKDEKTAEWGATAVPDAVGRLLKGE